MHCVTNLLLRLAARLFPRSDRCVAPSLGRLAHPQLEFALVLFCVLPTGAAAQPTRPSTRPALNPQVELVIVRCLAELDSPDFDIREKATHRLLELGPMVLEPLRTVLDGGVSPEFKARARFIERELPLRWRHISPEGGEIESGFQAILKPAGDGRLSLELRNAGGIERRLTDVRGLDVDLAHGGNKAETPWGDGCLLITPIGREPGATGLQPVVFEKGAPRKVDFKLGAAVTYEVKLDNIGLLAGDYEIKVVYYARSKELIDEAFGELVSNTVRASVRGK